MYSGPGESRFRLARTFYSEAAQRSVRHAQTRLSLSGSWGRKIEPPSEGEQAENKKTSHFY
jgi:hypothetical protein